MKKRFVFLILLSFIILGTFLRFNGIFWGYPYVLHADEGAIVNRAISMVEKGTFEAPGYETPGNIIKKISSIAYKAFSSFRYKTSFLSPEINTKNRAIYHVITRCISALFGSLTILLVYYIGRYRSVILGIIMAGLFAFFPIFVKHSHYGVPDITLTFFVCLVMVFGLKYTRHNTYFNVSLMSMASALGTVEKYPALFSCGMIALVIVLYNYKTIKVLIKQSIFSIFFYILTMFLISPNLFLNFNDVYARILIENRSTHLGADGLSWGGNLLYYIQTFTNYGGILLSFFGALGLIFLLIIKREKQNIVFFCGFIYWVLLSSRGLHWERWGMPMYAAFLFVAAFGIYYLISHKMTLLKKVLLYTCIVLCFTNLILSSAKESIYFNATDTRVKSIEYISNKGINKENTIYDGYTPLHLNGPTTLTNKLVIDDGKLYIRDVGKHFAIESSSMFSRYYREPIRYEDIVNIYNALHKEGELITTYSPISLNRSKYETKNIIYSISGIYRLSNNGLVGPKINFYDIRNIKPLK